MVKRLRHAVTGAFGVLAMSLSLAGCSGSPSYSDGIDNGAAASTQDNDDATSAPARELPPLPELSPFDEFRSILWGMGEDPESRQRRFEADRIVEENMIAQCMHELGFDCIPNFEAVRLVLNDNDNWRPDDPDWVADYGYGWVVTPEGGRGDGFSGIGVYMTNLGPNQAIVDELSETEARAWNDALWNQGAGFRRETLFSGIQMDCFNWARMTVNDERFAFQAAEEFTPLFEAIDQMQNNLRFDISDADRAWAACMFDAGFPDFDRQWEASELIANEYHQVRTSITARPDWVGNPTPENSPEIAELQEREVAVASADSNCRIATDFVAGREAHIHAVENQFITDHRAALEALRDAAEQRG